MGGIYKSFLLLHCWASSWICNGMDLQLEYWGTLFSFISLHIKFSYHVLSLCDLSRDALGTQESVVLTASEPIMGSLVFGTEIYYWSQCCSFAS